MKKYLKSLTTFAVAFLMLFFVGSIPAKADGATIALSDTDISIGDTVTATVNVSGGDIVAYTIYVSYSSGVLEFSGASGGTVGGGGGTLTISGSGAGSVSLTFSAISNGSASISTSGSEIYDINENELDFSHAGVYVNVQTGGDEENTEADSTTEKQEEEEDDDRSDNCRLSSLQISPGVLDPAFSPDTTSYYVNVKEDVTSMVVSAQTEDSKATTSVWGADYIEPGENTVKITVTAENGAVRVYNIRVVAGEDKGEAHVTLNGVLYNFEQYVEELEIPEGFSQTTFKYEDWEVSGYEGKNGKVKIVALSTVNEADETVYGWFLYDEKNKTFLPYLELSAQFVRYVILPLPEDTAAPDGFHKTDLVIDKKTISAYQNANIEDKNIYLIYTMNLDGGEGFYYFDSKEKSFMRYAIPVASPTEPEPQVVIATPEAPEPTVIVKYETKPEKGLDKNIKLLIYIGAGVLFLAMLLIIILFALRAKKLKDELNNADDIISHLSDGKHRSGKDYATEELTAEMLIEMDRAKKEHKKHKKQEQQEEAFGESTEQIEPEKAPAEDVPEKIAQIELPDVDALIAEVNGDLKNMYDPEKDSAFGDANFVDDEKK